MSDELDTRLIAANTKHRWTTLEEEIILYHEEQAKYYSLKGVAVRTWELLQSPRKVDEIVEALMEEYDVSDEVCRKDLLGCLRTLMQHGFVKYQDEAAG